MEEKFYLDDFELSLQEQMNQLKMVPSKKVWYGIYNDLHPGRRWPSVMISLLLIFSIVFVGYINTNPDKNATEKNVIAGGKIVSSAGANNPQSAQDIQQSEKLQNQVSNGVALAVENRSQNSRDLKSNEVNPASKRTEGKGNRRLKTDPGTKVAGVKDHGNMPSLSGLVADASIQGKTTSEHRNAIFPSEHHGNIFPGITDAFNESSIVGISNIPGVIENSSAFLLPHPFIEKQPKNQLSIQPVFDISIEAGLAANAENTTNGTREATRTKKKKNAKISWVYYAGASMSNVVFKGKPLKSPVLNSTLVASSSQQMQNDMRVIRSSAIGFEAGLQMNYAIIPNLEVTVGANITRSGYNIVSNLVHPTLSNLLLKDPSTGDTYTRGFVTHYGDGTGISTVTLHNFSYQASIPVGLQYKVWANDKIQVKLGFDVEPTYVINADAFVLSSNGKNFVEVPDLLRKWNVGSNFAPFVSFRSNKFRWNVGPNIRYQWLSSYEKSYPAKEHLIDYGIRVGISK